MLVGRWPLHVLLSTSVASCSPLVPQPAFGWGSSILWLGVIHLVGAALQSCTDSKLTDGLWRALAF